MKSIVYIKSYNLPEVDKKEALRYSGAEESDEMLCLLDSCIYEAEDKLTYKLCYSRFQIKLSGEEIDLGFTSVKSHSLARCLEGCHEIILFCATVGVGIDRLIRKYSSASPARAVMLQALGSERVEALCDAFCNEISASEREKGNVIRPRFSPGYGDLPLEVQRDVFEALDCTGKLGVTLSESLFMSPEKSVTAIIGIKEDK